MSDYHHFCLAFSDLEGKVYTSSGSVVLNLTNGAGYDRIALTLSPVQSLVLANGLRNITQTIGIGENDYGNIAGNLALDFPQELIISTPKLLSDHAAGSENIVHLDEIRPVT